MSKSVKIQRNVFGATSLWLKQSRAYEFMKNKQFSHIQFELQNFMNFNTHRDGFCINYIYSLDENGRKT